MFFILVRFFLHTPPQKFHDVVARDLERFVVESRTWLISRLNYGGDGSAFFYFSIVDLVEMARPSSSRGEDDREINADSPLVTRLSRAPLLACFIPFLFDGARRRCLRVSKDASIGWFTGYRPYKSSPAFDARPTNDVVNVSLTAVPHYVQQLFIVPVGRECFSTSH